MILDIGQIFGAAGFLQAPSVGNKPVIAIIGKCGLSLLLQALKGFGNLLKPSCFFPRLLIGFAIAKSVD